MRDDVENKLGGVSLHPPVEPRRRHQSSTSTSSVFTPTLDVVGENEEHPRENFFTDDEWAKYVERNISASDCKLSGSSGVFEGSKYESVVEEFDDSDDDDTEGINWFDQEPEENFDEVTFMRG